jgi:uncharacterized protein (TIGR02679 family)
MSADSVDGDRLRRVLGAEELTSLRLRLRARYERGAMLDLFTLTDLASHERRALAGLLGRRAATAGSMRLSRSELDAALCRAGIATSLRQALEFLDGPLSDRRADRASRQHSWDRLFASIEEPRLTALVADRAGIALVKRLAASNPERAKILLDQAARVLARLPGGGASRAQLAADVLGDAHGLDKGQAVGTLVLRACAADPSHGSVDAAGLQDSDETVRERWARLGVTVNSLTLPALCLNLPIMIADLMHQAGEPLHLSLRRLLRRPPTWVVANRDVFVCENPDIVAIAADRLGSRCAPLVCTDGMPSAAQQTLLGQLAAAGARLRYHGDFDWGGLTIGNFVMREFGAKPWRFGTTDYLAAASEHGIALRGGRPVTAQWDDALAGAMTDRGIAVHEEGVAEIMMMDLATQNDVAMGWPEPAPA